MRTGARDCSPGFRQPPSLVKAIYYDEVQEISRFNDQKADAFDRLITDAIKAKELHRVASTEDFVVQLANFSSFALGSEPIYRLRAVAAICKIGMLVKGLRAAVSRELAPLVAIELPALSTLNDPDDRYYASTLWRFVKPLWLQTYTAKSMADEDTAETTRAELANGLLVASQTVADAVESLFTELRGLRFQTEEASASRARRIRRCAEALRRGIARNPHSRTRVRCGRAPSRTGQIGV